jgi:hypothetical protein
VPTRLSCPNKLHNQHLAQEEGGDNFKATLAKGSIGAYFVKNILCAYSKSKEANAIDIVMTCVYTRTYNKYDHVAIPKSH